MTQARAPRIVLVADWWWPEQIGGAERSARLVAKTLAEYADVSVLVPAWRDASYQDGSLGVVAVRRPVARRAHAGSIVRRVAEFVATWVSPRSSAGLRQRLAMLEPDVVVVTNTARTGPWLLRWIKKQRL